MTGSVLAVFFLLHFVRPLLILGVLFLYMSPFALAVTGLIVASTRIRARRRASAELTRLPPPPPPSTGTEPPGGGLRG
jgi:hypothetical protein